MKSTKSPAVEAFKSAPVKPAAKSAAVETPAPAMETPAPGAAMRPSVGEIWLAERGGAQQSSCDGQTPSVLRPGFMFA
jgi:hypothetical protein